MPDIWLPGDEEVTVHIDTEGQVWVRNTVGMVRRPLDQRTGFASNESPFSSPLLEDK